MVSRRAALALLGNALGGATGGCLDGRQARPGDPTTDTASPTATPVDLSPDDAGSDPDRDDSGQTPDPNTPPADWPPDEWAPAWTHSVPVSHVVGLDDVAGRLVITANANRGPTVIQSYDPSARSVGWTRRVPGEAVPNSMLHRGPVARIWGVTATDDTILAVTGRQDEQWTELHALAPETGDSQWSLRRDRRLGIRGVVDGKGYVIARAFEERPTEHHHGSDTPTPAPLPATLLAVDLTDGSIRWRRAFTGIGAVAAGPTGPIIAVMNRLIGFDHDGNRRWTVRADNRGTEIHVSPRILYFVANPAWDRTVVRGVGHAGDVRWRRRFDADEAVKHSDRLYLAGDRLSAVRPDGTVVWRSEGHAGRLTFPPTDETVYIRTGRQADAVGAVALGDGARRWTFDPPMANAWPEAATDATVVAGAIGETPDGVGQPLYRVDAATGTASARYLDADPIVTKPFGDHAFVGIGSHEAGGRVLAMPL